MCMTREIGKFLGGLIGEVLEVDGGMLGDCVGKFMRIRVRIDLDKPMRRCLRMDIMGDGVETVMLLRYERLPNHCFKCGLVNHITTECEAKEPMPIVNGKEEPLSGTWLRATGPIHKFKFQSQKSMFFSPVNTDSKWRLDKGKEKVVPEFNTGDGRIVNLIAKDGK